MPLGPAKCFSCKGPKDENHYLCRTCWPQLPLEARRALNRKDRYAAARLRQLVRLLMQEVPLSEIRIAP